MDFDDSTAWETLRPLCEAAARRHGVVPEVHPLDFIFRFILDHPGFADDNGRVDYYFDDGARSARQLAGLISDTCDLAGSPLRLLEFASGYGCVTRHLLRALPTASVTSCDIHSEAVRFIEQTIGVPSILSDRVPEKLSLPGHYDLIFALSFFSHMPRTSWARWLSTLTGHLRPGGYLIFTTHGLRSAERHLGAPQLDPYGFWFRPESEQKDLGTSEYGTTVTSPSYVG